MINLNKIIKFKTKKLYQKILISNKKFKIIIITKILVFLTKIILNNHFIMILTSKTKIKSKYHKINQNIMNICKMKNLENQKIKIMMIKIKTIDLKKNKEAR